MPSRRRTSRTSRPTPRRYSRENSSLPPRFKAESNPDNRFIRRYRFPDEKERWDIHTQAKNIAKLLGKGRGKSSAKKATHDSPNAVADIQTSLPSSGVAAAEVTTAPDPVPDTGFTTFTSSMKANTTMDTVGAGYPFIDAITTQPTSITLHLVTTTTSTLLTRRPSSPSSFSALPPLLSLISTSTTTEYTRASFPDPTSELTPSPSITGLSRAAELKAHQITVVVAILLAVGSGLLLVGACILVKIFARPRRLQRPKPSLPILKDVETDEDFFEPKESPIFGGTARMSSNHGSNGPIWTWVQYPQTKSAGQIPQETKSCPSVSDSHYATRYTMDPEPLPTTVSRSGESFAGKYAMQSVPPVVISNKRLSRRSTVFHDPVLNRFSGSHETREAAYNDELGTGGGMKHSKSKATLRQSRQFEEKRYSTNSFAGLAYDADVTSPSTEDADYVKLQETPLLDKIFEGKARVKSGYFAAAGTYPRMSTLPSATYSIATATRVNVGQRNSFSNKRQSHQRSNSKRLRDTQALTYALGLSSPTTDYGAPSPQFTLYNEDLEATKRPKKRHLGDRKVAESIPDIPVIVPMQEPTDTTGALMGINFGVSHMSLSCLAGDDNGSDMHKPPRSTDKPPRVPSPPPLPSLTQMAMQQHNNSTDTYENHRSPTYIYGLYENDRKSFVR